MLSNRSCDITKIILISLGVCFILGGFGLLLLSYPASAVGTGSFTFLLAVDQIGPEELSQFRYTQWRKPSKGIRPFIFSPKSFEDCKILRYRRGSRPYWYVWVTYYEAEYMMPDGSKVIGPAFGPLPYVAPNLFLIIPLILAGIVMFVIGIVLGWPVKREKVMDISVVNLEEKFAKIKEQLSPKIIAQMNNYHFKLVKSKGEFIWHKHPETDEVFMIIEGDFQIHLRDKVLQLKKGEMVVIPKGVEHKPFAKEECKVLLIEPEGTLNTGDAGGDLTVTDLEWI